VRTARLILLLGALLAVAPSTALALTNAEKKAVNIKSAKGASTANAAYVEIRFKGDAEDLLGTGGLRNTKLKVKFVPASGGKATKITETGPSDDAETRRRGTKGKTDVIRAGRTFAVLVRKLPSLAGKVVVTTSGPGKLDKLRKKLRPLTTEATLELEGERTDAQVTSLRNSRTDADYKFYGTQDKIKNGDLNRKQRKRQQAKLVRLSEQRAALTARLAALDLWAKVVDKALNTASKRACNDGVDNGDPEDSIADFGFDKDPGCVMPTDDDEANAPMNLTCPNPGQSDSVTATLAISGASAIERFIISLPPSEADKPRRAIVDAPVTAQSGGPYPLETDITQLCNYEFDFVYGYQLTTQGAPAGSYLLRVTVSVTNGGGYPGGAVLPMMLAAGTTR
jgi:hypothetical protein